MNIYNAYAEWTTIEADFSAALVRVYGKKAGDARYKYHHEDAECERLRVAFQAAADRWHNEIVAERALRTAMAEAARLYKNDWKP